MRIVYFSFTCLLCLFLITGLDSNSAFSNEAKPQTRENDAVKEPVLKGFDKLRSDIKTAFAENKLLKSNGKTWELSIESSEDQALKVYPDDAFVITRIERNKYKVELSYPWLLLRADNLAEVSYKTKKRGELTSYVELKSKNGEKYDNKILSNSRYRLVASPNYAHFVGIEGNKFFFEREIGRETTGITILLQYLFTEGYLTISHEELPIIGEKKNTIHPWQVKVLPKQSSCIHSLDYSPDGKILVSALGSYNTETEKYYSEIKFWDVQDISNPVQLQVIEELDTDAQAICFSPDGKTLAAVYGKVTGRKSKELTTMYTCDEWDIFEGEVKLWDVSDLSDIKEIFAHRADGRYQEIAAFSPNGKFLATGSDVNTIQIWDTSDLSNVKERVTLIGHEGRIASLQFSPDGKILASGSWDDTIKLISFYDLDDIREICTLVGHKGSVRSVDFSPDGSKLLTCAHHDYYKGEIKIWDVKTHKCLKTIETRSVTYRAKFSPDGTKIAVGYGRIDGKVIIWDIRNINEPEIIAAHTDFEEMVWDLAFSPDGKTLAIASWDNYIKLWNIAPSDLEINKIVSEIPEKELSKVFLKGNEIVYKFALSSNGKYLVTKSKFFKNMEDIDPDQFTVELKVWDISNIDEVKLYKKFTRIDERIGKYQFTPDSKYLVIQVEKVQNNEDQDISSGIEFLDISDGSVAFTLQEEDSEFSTFTFSPDGKYLFTGSTEGVESSDKKRQIKFWDYTDFSKVRNVNTVSTAGFLRSLTVSPNGKYLLYTSYSAKGLVNVLDITNIENPKKVISEIGYFPNIWCFSPDSEILVVVSRYSSSDYDSDMVYQIEFWDINSGTQICTRPRYTSQTNDICFSSDGKYLFTGSMKGNLNIWDVSDVNNAFEIGTIGNHGSWIKQIMLTRDGLKLISFSTDKTYKSWSIGKIIAKLKQHKDGK